MKPMVEEQAKHRIGFQRAGFAWLLWLEEKQPDGKWIELPISSMYEVHPFPTPNQVDSEPITKNPNGGSVGM